MQTLLTPAFFCTFVLLFHTSSSLAQQPVASETTPADQSSVASSSAGAGTDLSGPSHAPGESLARIVRLSQERGMVQMDRSTGNGFEAASPNMPVVQGVRLRTGDGLAEVEFEDNSSLRLTPDTEVDFPQLKLKDGAKVTVVDVKRGSVYVSMATTRDNSFQVQFAGHTLTLSPSAHVHLFAGNPETRLTVISGEAHVEGGDGVAVATKKQTITFDSAGAKPPQVAKGLIHADYDEWDKNEVDYQKRYALVSSVTGSPYGYGLADLNYYGSFADSGCGQMWQPYFAGAGWSPYSAGLWAWYPGAGYSWVSMYPWGWTPFHSGEWAYCRGTGWGWRPTGGWNGISNLQRLRLTGNGGGTPIKPPAPPRPRQPTITVARASGPLPISGVQPSGQFIFNRDSAGIGVPRGAFTHLDKISANVAQHGTVATTLNSRVISTVNASSLSTGGTRANGAGFTSVGGSRTTASSNASANVSNVPAATHASAPSAPAVSSASVASSHR